MRNSSDFRFAFLAAGFLLAAALLFVGGCSDDSEDPVPPELEQEPLVIASPDSLMSRFETIYTDMQIYDFTDLLHPDFEMSLLAEVLENWEWPVDFTFDRDDMISIHVNMFGGLPGVDQQGNEVHPVDSIEIPLLDPQAAWTAVTSEDGYFGQTENAKSATYQVLIQFYNADISHKYEVQQEVVFYVADISGDEETENYRLLGLRGLPLYNKTDEASWGQVLSLYRDAENIDVGNSL